jgi:hypothetical protein
MLRLKRLSIDERPGREGDRARECDRAPMGERDLSDLVTGMKLPRRALSSSAEEPLSIWTRISYVPSEAKGSSFR